MSGPEYILGGERVPVTWRTGRHAGRTVYAQAGPEPSDADLLIGVMDTPELAAEACEGRNRLAARTALLAKLDGAEQALGTGTSPQDPEAGKTALRDAADTERES